MWRTYILGFKKGLAFVEPIEKLLPIVLSTCLLTHNQDRVVEG